MNRLPIRLDIRPKWGRLLSFQAIVGEIVGAFDVARYVLRLVGDVETLSFIAAHAQDAWTWVLGPTGQLITFLGGIGLVVWALSKPESQPRLSIQRPNAALSPAEAARIATPAEPTAPALSEPLAQAPVQPSALPPSPVRLKVERQRHSHVRIYRYETGQVQATASLRLGIENRGEATAARNVILDWRKVGGDATTETPPPVLVYSVDNKPEDRFFVPLGANSPLQWHRLQFGASASGFGGRGAWKPEDTSRLPRDLDLVLTLEVDSGPSISAEVAQFRDVDWHVRQGQIHREILPKSEVEEEPSETDDSPL